MAILLPPVSDVAHGYALGFLPFLAVLSAPESPVLRESEGRRAGAGSQKPLDVDTALSGQAEDVGMWVGKERNEMIQRFLLRQLDCATTCDSK